MIFFGLALLGIIVLMISYGYSRSVMAIVFWGIVGGALMGLQCLVLKNFAGLEAATSGGNEIQNFLGVAAFGILIILVLYFAFALARLNDRR